MSVDPIEVQAIFSQAVEIEDVAARTAFLDRACTGEAELRDRVEALLLAHGAPGLLLDEPVRGVCENTTVHFPEAAPGALIAGRFKLLEQIGEGGMGVVWMAEQRAPMRRPVALRSARRRRMGSYA